MSTVTFEFKSVERDLAVHLTGGRQPETVWRVTYRRAGTRRWHRFLIVTDERPSDEVVDDACRFYDGGLS